MFLTHTGWVVTNNAAILAQLLDFEGIDHTSLLDSTKIEGFLSKNNAVSLIFLDLEMPGLNGYEVIQQLKGDDRFRHIPVIAYTVHVSEIQNARNYGFNGFIGKPLDADLFPEYLQKIMAGEEVWVTP